MNISRYIVYEKAERYVTSEFEKAQKYLNYLQAKYGDKFILAQEEVTSHSRSNVISLVGRSKRKA